MLGLSTCCTLNEASLPSSSATRARWLGPLKPLAAKEQSGVGQVRMIAAIAQLLCPPTLQHEYAIVEFMRMFAECPDSEAFNLLDIIDSDCLVMLGLPQVCS